MNYVILYSVELRVYMVIPANERIPEDFALASGPFPTMEAAEAEVRVRLEREPECPQ